MLLIQTTRIGDVWLLHATRRANPY